MKKFEVKDVCFFDCETTGVPAKGLNYAEHFITSAQYYLT